MLLFSGWMTGTVGDRDCKACTRGGCLYNPFIRLFCAGKRGSALLAGNDWIQWVVGVTFMEHVRTLLIRGVNSNVV